jgi:apyrase
VPPGRPRLRARPTITLRRARSAVAHLSAGEGTAAADAAAMRNARMAGIPERCTAAAAARARGRPSRPALPTANRRRPPSAALLPRRHRSALLLVSVPLVLVFLIVLLMPGGATRSSDHFRRSQPFAEARYAVVVDAGSTGSRVHVFTFQDDGSGALDLLDVAFKQLKPGLSSFGADAAGAAESLRPLLDAAVAAVPAAARAATPVMVGATAGLRLLPGGEADAILAEVRRWLRTFPFTFAAKDVKVLAGTDEGAFAWLTLNFLLGRLGGPPERTVSAIDLGGGSVQQAYALTPAEAAAAPPGGDYVARLRGGGREYSVYVHSYLGYGLMAGRAAVLGVDPNGPDDDSHPCVPTGHEGEYVYGDAALAAVGHADGASHAGCAAAVDEALARGRACGAPQAQCGFAGAWGGPRVPEAFYISSYFWDRAKDAGLVPASGAVDHRLEPRRYGELARRACGLDLPALRREFPHLPDDQHPFLCLDLTYAHGLLTRGFRAPDAAEVTVVKAVRHRGREVEAAWPLGAAIDALGRPSR